MKLGLLVILFIGVAVAAHLTYRDDRFSAVLVVVLFAIVALVSWAIL